MCALKLGVPDQKSVFKPRILVLGVGGAGGNAVNNMIQADLQGVEFAVANTDAQALEMSLSDRRVRLGTMATQGLGAVPIRLLAELLLKNRCKTCSTKLVK